MKSTARRLKFELLGPTIKPLELFALFSFPAFFVLFLVIFLTGRWKALFFFLFATAAAISRLVIGTLSEDS